ncbi:hypothetical protein RD792_011643 [Penstemon davidsonii]|uniref:Disease resistance protein n=1 Tax=Penstemon davidsonii TaxID=160366 RepID=A0ABR0CUQ3_9LAMI|nr:hypothetical protein RD792_011643 [Penstemon davidsonii]
MAEMVMLEVAVTFALETIRDLVVEEAKFLRAVDGEVKQLQEELGRIQWFLKDAKAPNVDKERIKAWVMQFQDIAYDVEDVIESYALKNGSRRKRRSGLAKSTMRCICLNEARESHQVGLQIQELSTWISNLKKDFETYGVKDIIQSGGASSSLRTRQQLRRSYSHVLEEDFVGLESDVEMLVKQLVHGKHKVVSIFGMGGLGKTTLAQKIYNHPLIKSHFHASSWVCVTQEWKTTDLLQRILIKISPHKKDEILKFDEIELVRELANAQSDSRKFILILDDIWDPIAWESIKKAIHKDAKILLTTRKHHVAEVIGPNGFHHQPRLLNEEECWALLQKKSLSNTGEVSKGMLFK